MPSSETNTSAQATNRGGRGTAARGTALPQSSIIGVVISALLLCLWVLCWRLRLGDGWIHLLPVIALVALAFIFIPGKKNIEAEQCLIPKWDPAHPVESLAEIHAYVIGEAGRSMDWYWQAKRTKARLSQAIRFVAWVLAAAGGLLPVIGSLSTTPKLANGLWASLLLGIAAALLGLDKAFGYSSGWARYVLAATNIHKTLEDFRMEWPQLMAKAGTALTPENVLPLIERAQKCRNDVEGLVLQETKDWVTEFQNNMGQMEKDIAAQVATLKAEADKATQARRQAEQPGSLQLQVQSANKVQAGTTINVSLTDAKDNTIAQENISGSTWAKLNLPAGQYKIRIQATVNGQTAEVQKVAVIKPGEPADVQLAL